MSAGKVLYLSSFGIHAQEYGKNVSESRRFLGKGVYFNLARRRGSTSGKKEFEASARKVYEGKLPQGEGNHVLTRDNQKKSNRKKDSCCQRKFGKEKGVLGKELANKRDR